MFKRTMAIAAGMLLTASGLSAQMGQMHGQRPDTMPGMMGQGMMMGGMMGQGMMQMMGHGMGMMATGGPGPAVILRMGDALELTEDQVSRLERIQEDASAARRPHMEAAMSAHRTGAQALQGDSPDFTAYEQALSEAATHMVQAHVAMARASVRAREVLTEEQLGQLHSGMRMMRGMMGRPEMGAMMERGRMRHRPMP